MPASAREEQTPTNSSLAERIASTGQELASSLQEVVDATAERPLTPQGLARALGVNKDLSHRLVTALRKRDPFATTYLIPGPEPLRRLLVAAAKKGVRAELVRRAEAADFL